MDAPPLPAALPAAALVPPLPAEAPLGRRAAERWTVGLRLEGARVAWVEPGGPAALVGGLAAGDEVVAVDGRQVRRCGGGAAEIRRRFALCGE